MSNQRRSFNDDKDLAIVDTNSAIDQIQVRTSNVGMSYIGRRTYQLGDEG